jgi:hypothetical protein
MSSEQQDELGQLVALLATKRVVEFSFLPAVPEQTECAVSVRECDEADFAEYGEEPETGAMFEVGPPLQAQPLIETKLRFSTMQQAGDAVLKRRAEILGVPWGDV